MVSLDAGQVLHRHLGDIPLHLLTPAQADAHVAQPCLHRCQILNRVLHDEILISKDTGSLSHRPPRIILGVRLHRVMGLVGFYYVRGRGGVPMIFNRSKGRREFCFVLISLLSGGDRRAGTVINQCTAYTSAVVLVSSKKTDRRS